VIKERRETLVSRQTTKLSDDEIQRKKKIHSKKKKKKVVSFPFHTKNNKKWISIGDDDSRDDNDEREMIFRWSAAKKRKTHYSGFIFDAATLSLSLSLSLSFGFNFFFFVRGNKMWDSFFCLSSSNIYQK